MVVGFIRVPVDSLERPYRCSGSFWFAWVHTRARSSGYLGFAHVHSVAHYARRVNLDSCGYIRPPLGIVAFICVPLCSLRRAQDSSGSFEFA